MIGTPGNDTLFPKPGIIGYNAAWKEADFLTYTAGTAAKLPAPTGSMAALAGPVYGTPNIVVVQHASAGAPGGVYYIVVSYTATTNESNVSQEFTVASAAGYVPGITAASAGAPAAATDFAVYASLFSGGEALQQASKTTTALGTQFNIPNALINQYGFQRSASSDSALLALSMHDSAEIYEKGLGGGNTAGGPGNILGIWANPPPFSLDFNYQALVYSLGGRYVEMSLVQPWNQGLVGAAVGITLDATSNQFVADTGATQIGNIAWYVDGSPAAVGGPFQTGTRVAVLIEATAAY